MTITADFVEDCERHGKAAQKKMAEHGIPPTPINYAVWYAYVSDTVPGVRQMLDVLISNKRVITTELCQELFNKYFSHLDDGLLLQDAGIRLEHEVGKIITWIDDVADSAEDFDDSIK